MSDQLMQRELAVAARNAEKNRSINSSKGYGDNKQGRRRNTVSMKQSKESSNLTAHRSPPTSSHVHAPRRTLSAPTTNEENDAIRARGLSKPLTKDVNETKDELERKSEGQSDFGAFLLQSSLQNMVSEWNSALKSIFPDPKQDLNEDSKGRSQQTHPTLLVLL